MVDDYNGRYQLNSFVGAALYISLQLTLSLMKDNQPTEWCKEYQIGDHVHYIRDNCTDPAQYENGIVKNFGDDPNKYFVVYNCGGEWDRYKEYTAALTDTRNLRAGWNYES